MQVLEPSFVLSERRHCRSINAGPSRAQVIQSTLVNAHFQFPASERMPTKRNFIVHLAGSDLRATFARLKCELTSRINAVWLNATSLNAIWLSTTFLIAFSTLWRSVTAAAARSFFQSTYVVTPRSDVQRQMIPTTFLVCASFNPGAHPF